jgi:hypothetical protein
MIYNDDLKLIYVLKIGYNTKGDGIYEFVFSMDEENIDVEGWCWDMSPACDNCMPPTEEYVDATIEFKTKSFDLFCLHEAVDREYMHGYNTIHALAYEKEYDNDQFTDGFSDFDKMFNKSNDDKPLLVFHYGTTLSNIKEMLNDRKIILKDNEFIETSSIEI